MAGPRAGGSLLRPAEGSVSLGVASTRAVCARSSAEAFVRGFTRGCPPSITLRPKGGEAQPPWSWLVITAVSVDAGLPVDNGRAVSLNSSTKARTMLWVDEP